MSANAQVVQEELQALDLETGPVPQAVRTPSAPRQARLDLGRDLVDEASMLVDALEAGDEQAVRDIVAASESEAEADALRRAAYACAQQRFHIGPAGDIAETTVFAVPIILVPVAGGGRPVPVGAPGLVPTLHQHLTGSGLVRARPANVTLVGRLYSPFELMRAGWVDIYALAEQAREAGTRLAPSQTPLPFVGQGHRVRLDHDGGEPMVWFLVGAIGNDEPFTNLFLDSQADAGEYDHWRVRARQVVSKVLEHGGIRANVGVGSPAPLHPAVSRGVAVWNELRVRKAGQRATRLNAGLGVDTTVDPQFDGTGFTLQFWDTRTGRWLAEARWHCFGEAGRGMEAAQEVLERLRRTHIVPPSRGQAWAAAVH